LLVPTVTMADWDPEIYDKNKCGPSTGQRGTVRWCRGEGRAVGGRVSVRSEKAVCQTSTLGGACRYILLIRSVGRAAEVKSGPQTDETRHGGRPPRWALSVEVSQGLETREPTGRYLGLRQAASLVPGRRFRGGCRLAASRTRSESAGAGRISGCCSTRMPGARHQNGWEDSLSTGSEAAHSKVDILTRRPTGCLASGSNGACE
jgi:hypothetical protein